MQMLKFTITTQKGSPESIQHLRGYLLRGKIDGLGKISFETQAGAEGEMGGEEILTALSVVLDHAKKPFAAFIRFLNDYVISFKTEIVVKKKNGSQLKISSRRLMKEDIEKVIEEFFD